MKHKLKTLLVTSVLSTAAVFGADAWQGDDNETTKEKQPVSQKTKVTANTGSLGLLCNEMFSEITGAVPRSETLPPKNLILGYLSFDDLISVSKTSRAFHKHAQPMLNFAKPMLQAASALRSNLLAIFRNPTPTAYPTRSAIVTLGTNLISISNPDISALVSNPKVLALFNFPSPNNAHHAFFHVLLSLSNTLLSVDDITHITTNINDPNQFNLNEKAFVLCALPSATPEEIVGGIALLVKDLDSPPKVTYLARLCNRLLTHDNATLENLFSAADILFNAAAILSKPYVFSKNVQKKMFDKAASLYIKAANHRNVTPSEIFAAAEKLEYLGKEFAERAANLYEKAAFHSDATPSEIIEAAYAIDILGEAYSDKAASLFATAAQHKDATISDILKAAYYLKGIGENYYEKTASLYEEAAKRSDATLSEIIDAAENLDWLGKAFAERSASIYEKASHHRDVTPSEIMKSADCLKSFGENYYDRAAVLYERSADHQDATPYETMKAAYYLRSLGEKYNEKVAFLNEEAAKHKDATRYNIGTAINMIGQIRDTYPTDSAEYKKYDGKISELHKLKESRSK